MGTKHLYTGKGQTVTTPYQSLVLFFFPTVISGFWLGSNENTGNLLVVQISHPIYYKGEDDEKLCNNKQYIFVLKHKLFHSFTQYSPNIYNKYHITAAEL